MSTSEIHCVTIVDLLHTPRVLYGDDLDQRCADTGEPVDLVGPYSGSGFSQLSIRIPTAVKQVITNQGSSHDLEAIGAVGHRATISCQINHTYILKA